MAEPRGHASSVLIADDDSLVRMVMRMVLQKLGHEVVEASSSEAFADALATRQFALCVMDASMPGMSLDARLDLAASVAPDMPMIVISGYSEPPAGVKDRGIRFMSKPIDLPSMTSAVASLELRGVEVDPA